MPALWYHHPRLYIFGMTLIHGKEFRNRFKRIAKIIGKNKSVLDLGAGPPMLYYFLGKGCKYEGWDLNKKFVDYYNKRGINMKLCDCLDYHNYPDVDCIVLCDILHHVAPNQSVLLRNALKKTKEIVIVCEPFKGKENPFYWFSVKVRQKIGLERIFGDFDGINKKCHHYPIMSKKELINFLNSHGECKIIKKKISLTALYKVKNNNNKKIK